MSVFEIIEAKQKGIEGSPVWMVGEQLKEICAADPHCAELVEKDLDDPAMNLVAAERKIKAWADKQKKVNNCVCVPPNKAEEIIREFYGLPARMPAKPLQLVEKPKEEPAATDELDLFSLF